MCGAGVEPLDHVTWLSPLQAWSGLESLATTHAITYGCSLYYIRLQPPLHTVAGVERPREPLDHAHPARLAALPRVGPLHAPHATEGSNPGPAGRVPGRPATHTRASLALDSVHLADRVPGRPATHTCEPRLALDSVHRPLPARATGGVARLPTTTIVSS
eukprot:scaffold34071_cov48-Phaeocystis_antarctica.AAC.4